MHFPGKKLYLHKIIFFEGISFVMIIAFINGISSAQQPAILLQIPLQVLQGYRLSFNYRKKQIKIMQPLRTGYLKFINFA